MPRHEHLHRGEPEEGHKFSLDEDKQARAIAKSERKAHPDYSRSRALSIGYGRVINERKIRKEK